MVLRDGEERELDVLFAAHALHAFAHDLADFDILQGFERVNDHADRVPFLPTVSALDLFENLDCCLLKYCRIVLIATFGREVRKQVIPVPAKDRSDSNKTLLLNETVLQQFTGSLSNDQLVRDA